MNKKMALLFSLLMFFIISFPYSEAFASAQLDVQAEIGINNKIKQERATPLTVTITNNGDSFSGDFVIDAEVSYSLGSALVFPLDIGSGESKTFQIYLDGYSDNLMYTMPREDYFHFYEGGIEKGKKVDYSGDHYVTPRMLDYDAQLLFVVTNNEDRLGGVKRLNQFTAMNTEIIFINNPSNAYLAEDPRALQMVDYILFDEIAISDLSDKQQQALYSWVQQGGTVLVGANDFGAGAAGVFEASLPLVLGNTTATITADELASITNNGVFTADIAVNNATLKDAAANHLLVNGKMLMAETQIGKGRIMQTTFSLGDEPLSSMAGYGKLLAEILALTNYNHQFNGYQSAAGYGANWMHLNELFPSFKFTSGWVIAIIIIYIIVIGPVLYFILKRFDKREKMWVYVPIAAIVTSLLFFVFGAKDRLLNPQIQQMALYEVQEDGTLIGSYTNALLSNKGGDFVFETDAQTTAVAYGAHSNLTSSELHKKSYIQQIANGQRLTLNNMDYWSVQSIVGKTTISEAGKLDVKLTLSNGILSGTVTNNLPVDLKQVKVLSGVKEYELGDIKANETIDVKQDIKSQTLSAPIHNYSYQHNFSSDEELFNTKLDNMKGSAIESVLNQNKPVIVGWSDVSLVPVQLVGNAETTAMSYFVQSISPEVILKGDVTFTVDDIIANIEPLDMARHGYIENNDIYNAYISDGEFRVIYELIADIDMANIALDSLQLKYKDSVIYTEVYNHKTDSYEPLDSAKVTLTENVENYMNAERQLILKVSRVGMDDGMPVQLPTFELKGVVKK
ncbi:hypothetical protein AAGS61_11820 [Lysinibacillus sp. KU-BSD001]|uniref:hypothetical protein n=1 Tax=Lysinibacillus sp. KU-BSD001 TaxID=3141328 RepID=UPI0036E98FEB